MEQFINKVIQGDCLIKLKELEDNSVDSIVTDPPAGISFMGKSWDTDKGGRDNWIKWMQEVATECKRVLKPGGHAFVWTIPRTSHWTATAWENAGFEIRDVVAHVFGSGFPKSLNIGKAVDKLQGNERQDLGESYNNRDRSTHEYNSVGNVGSNARITKGTSEWEGWGTALKPAREDWLLMRKPLDKGLTIAENCLKWGTGGINIDESRVETEDKMSYSSSEKQGVTKFGTGTTEQSPLGRFPANLIHDNSEEVRECFPETKSGKAIVGTGKGFAENASGISSTGIITSCFADSGNASRYFKSILYYPKASKSERNAGLDVIEDKNKRPQGEAFGDGSAITEHSERKGNFHPTVKPIALMEYLIKMVTPKGGIVLDPFAGSGSTLVAAKQNGYKYIGIEITEEYIPIIEARLLGVENDLFKDIL